MVSLFTDGFETGDVSLWTSTRLGGDGVQEVQNVTKLFGTYAFHSSLHATTLTTQARAAVQKNFAGQTVIFMRQHFYVAGTAANLRLTLAAFYNGVPGGGGVQSPLNVGIRNGNLMLTYYRNSVNFATEYDPTTPIPVSYNVWHTLEIAVTLGGVGVGRVRVWLDKAAGDEANPDIDSSLFTAPGNEIDSTGLVAVTYGATGGVFADVNLPQHDVYVDAVAISTTYVGPFVEGNWYLTITRSPQEGGTSPAIVTTPITLALGTSSAEYTATPAPGYRFTGWSGPLVSPSQTAQTITVPSPITPNQTLNLIANFAVGGEFPSWMFWVIGGIASFGLITIVAFTRKRRRR